MKRFLSIILCFNLCLTLAAMDRQAERINIIKKDTAYIFADVTMASMSEAMSQAYGQLQHKVSEWAKQTGEKQPADITPVDINSLADTILTQRIDMYRVFVYAKKEHLRQLFHGVAVQKISPSLIETDTIAQKPKEVAPEKLHRFLNQIYSDKNSSTLEKIKKAKDFFELKEILEPLKQSGEILEYGKYATMQEPEECYLIVYDKAGNILALLDKGSDKRKNLKTNKEDSIVNYRGCGAIWFKLKS